MQQAAARFADYLSRNRLRMTRERRVILEQVLAVGKHFDVDDLLVHMRNGGLRASRATLYRTLAHLVDSGMVHKVEMAKGQARYEPMLGRHHHDHLVCLKCGDLHDVYPVGEESIVLPRDQSFGYQLVNREILFQGYCPRCSPTAQ